jgi:hypothetical protein
VFIGVLSSISWLSDIYEQKVVQQRWQAATGKIVSLSEQSKEVKASPSSTNRQKYSVFWIDVEVLFGEALPCPSETYRKVSGAASVCVGIVRTPAVRWQGDLSYWKEAHPVGSMLLVRYESPGGRMVPGGLASWYLLRWDRIAVTVIMIMIGLVAIMFSHNKFPIRECNIPIGAAREGCCGMSTTTKEGRR